MKCNIQFSLHEHIYDTIGSHGFNNFNNYFKLFKSGVTEYFDPPKNPGLTLISQKKWAPHTKDILLFA